MPVTGGLSFLIPILISAGLGSISGGISAFQRSRANRQQAEAAERQRQSLEQMLSEIFATDTTSAPINAASRQIGGQFASAGLAGSGMNQAAAGEAAASIMAQDLARRQALEAQVRGDPSFLAPDASGFRPGIDALLGAFGGFAGGAGQAAGNMLATEPGWNAWSQYASTLGQPPGGGGVANAQIPSYSFTPMGTTRRKTREFGVTHPGLFG